MYYSSGLARIAMNPMMLCTSYLNGLLPHNLKGQLFPGEARRAAGFEYSCSL
jgi:hypothetical protein